MQKFSTISDIQQDRASKNKGIFFQPKLSINQPNDAYEQEANAIADKVMRMTAPYAKNNFFFNPSVTSIQRKCAHCEEEEKKMQRKENNNDAVHTSDKTENYIQSLSGGSKLSEEDRIFFGSRMGYDFSDVQMHTDAKANESAKSINASAYTYSNNIVFNLGQYQPDTNEGKKLLAHELTHVVQQNSGINRLSIQRDTDFDKGHELTSTALSGDPILKSVFDNQRVIHIGDHGDHVKKIQDGLLTLGIALPQFGADSSYGTETSNAVKDFQRRAGMSVREQDGIVGRKTIGLLDRSLRNGVISTDTDNAANDFTFTPEANANCTGPTTQPCDTWYTDIDALIGESASLIDKTVAEQLPPHKTPNADYESIFATLFRNGDTSPLSSTVDKVSQNYWLTRTYMTQLLTDRSFIVCGTQCDGGCASGSPAHEMRTQSVPNNSSNDPQKNVIVFCPSFRTHPERVLIVLHESHHAAVNGSKDWAYPSERLITMLDHDKALLNAASFHLYSKAVKDPASVSLGHAVADTNNITNATERDKVNRCLAFIEHWFRLLTYDLSDTIAGTRDAKNTGRYNNRSAEQIMGEIMHPWFGLTNPPSRPVQTDVDKLTAIKQRCEWMEKDLKNAFTINLVTGASRWLPAPQSIIDVNSSTTALPEPRLCMALLQELVHATPDISADTESLYVGMINEMRNARHFDPQ